MMLDDAMRGACAAIGIVAPKKVSPGRWSQSPVIGKAASNTSGRVMIFDDRQGGIAWNWATGERQPFSILGQGAAAPARPRDLAKERQQEAERAEIHRICAEIVRTSQESGHPYFVRKGFPEEVGLVHEAPWRCFPSNALGEALTKAMPEGNGPWLIVPGRIGQRITTVQFISPEGAKKNILRGQMGGASRRIGQGRETWVCEGIATALSVRAALRFLGRSATVLSAFSASNVAKVASELPGAIIAADHDKPVEAFGGLGTGEFYALRSGCKWVMPSCMGDFNDLHQSEGLRAVALQLKGVGMG